MELTIIKQDGGTYIDSRQVAEAIGKKHQHLLRDIRGYIDVYENFGVASNFGRDNFFLESSYLDPFNRERPCYLLTKMGCEMVATKLTGAKGVMFSFAYVSEFNRLEQSEREQLTKQAATPRLAVFNKAIRTVMGGLTSANASANTIMKFLRDSYRPFGIEIAEFDESERFYSASIIARALGVYSLYGRPHAHAVAAIIGKLDMNSGGHIEVAPYGMVGFSVRYDIAIAEAVKSWLIAHGKPLNIPHNGFEYHVCYDHDNSIFGDSRNYDDERGADAAYLRSLSAKELNELCWKYGDCEICPYLGGCSDTYDLD